MAYYVSAIKGPKRLLLLGPYNTHGAALAEVDRVRRYCADTYRDDWDVAYGTAHHKTGHPAGVLNDRLAAA